ncbi:MAG: aldehyde dehydrogenase family protein, partial [Pseudomonadota bacterium]
MFDTKLLVQGAWRDAEGAKTFQRSRSSAGSPATSAADAALADVDAIGKAAASAQANWANTGPNARRKLLNAAADRLEAHRDEFIRRMQAEVGATVGWAGFNVMLGAGILREAASATTHITGDIVPSDVPGSFAMAQRKPLGPVLGIAPWNAPVILAVRAVAMPLACGNAAVLKGSEQCPATHALVCEV